MNRQCYCPAPTEGWQESVASGSGERTTGNSVKLAVRRPSLYCFVGKISGVKIPWEGHKRRDGYHIWSGCRHAGLDFQASN